MMHSCPDCDRPQPALIAAATPPNVARLLCSDCGYPLRYLDWGEWAMQYGWRLDVKDEFKLLAYHDGEDDELLAA